MLPKKAFLRAAQKRNPIPTPTQRLSVTNSPLRSAATPITPVQTLLAVHVGCTLRTITLKHNPCDMHKGVPTRLKSTDLGMCWLPRSRQESDANSTAVWRSNGKKIHRGREGRRARIALSWLQRTPRQQRRQERHKKQAQGERVGNCACQRHKGVGVRRKFGGPKPYTHTGPRPEVALTLLATRCGTLNMNVCVQEAAGRIAHGAQRRTWQRMPKRHTKVRGSAAYHAHKWPLPNTQMWLQR